MVPVIIRDIRTLVLKELIAVLNKNYTVAITVYNDRPKFIVGRYVVIWTRIK